MKEKENKLCTVSLIAFLNDSLFCISNEPQFIEKKKEIGHVHNTYPSR